MARTMDWRSPNAGDALRDLDRAGLAWEFLRRNPEYREDYRRALERVAIGALTEEAAMAAISRRWGLSFRPRSRRASKPSPDDLAARTFCRPLLSLSLRLTAIPRLKNSLRSISPLRARAPSALTAPISSSRTRRATTTCGFATF